MDPRLTEIWTALDRAALAVGQADIVGQLLAENRRLMLTYLDVYRQMAESQRAPNGKPKQVVQP